MKNVSFISRACLFACILLVAVSCKDTDDYFSSKDGDGGSSVSLTANSFNFSTTQKVDLQVDYSAFKTYGPVRFSIYNKNPFVEGDPSNPYYLDENLEPIFEDFTDEDGKYDKTVSLPAYAKVLYIVTGDLFVSQKRMIAEIVNGRVSCVAVNEAKANGVRTTRATTGAGTLTRDLSNLWNLSYECTDSKSGKTSGWAQGTKQVYKVWYTPLGMWDAGSGRPDYLMERTPENIAKGLVFTDEELESLFAASKAALKSTSTCSEEYRTQADMTLQQESEVSITILGGNTCWCSSLGYYYYTEENKPQSTMDLNIIMLFPNTMNNHYDDFPNTNYNGNIGTYDGDAIQLMYYPNIADYGDTSGATTKFPKGTKIGFIMKSNGWAMQRGTGSNLYYITAGTGTGKKVSWDCGRRYNTWPTSTEGMSYCNPTDNNNFKYLNPNGESRTAKFGYVSPEGKEYAIIGFEDANNDLNYSDVIFALNPASAFTPLPEVEEGKSSSVGVWAFEDLWPSRGDYDMNDVVVNVKNEKNFNSSGKVTKQVFYMTTYRKSVELVNGLAARVITASDATVKSVAMKKMAPGVTDTRLAEAVTYQKYNDSNTGFDIYYLTNYVEEDLGSTYILELNYSTPLDVTKAAEVEPFLYRSSGGEKQLEVHVPRTSAPAGTDCVGMPTDRMNTVFFGTVDDKSDPARNMYFVREGNYPFAFYLSGTKAEAFFDTILGGESANLPIDTFYPTFIPWSQSKGADYKDWYLR